MKVLKFGGTSVGTAASLRNVKAIAEGCQGEVIVVVSAFGGITDQLIDCAGKAAAGDGSYVGQVSSMRARHFATIGEIIPSGEARTALEARVTAMFAELESIFTGVCLIRDLSDKTLNTIVSYGERLSSDICSVLIEGARLHDSRDFIKTYRRQGRNILDSELTNELIRKEFASAERISLVPGFISGDRSSGEITNLGRGGSDYTASLIAAALGAEALEIWTDVDGFMTADPKVISNAYVIDSLTYHEAVELCNFGAKVVYPPTIYPACVNNIPIYIRNTFRPEARGTVIVNDNRPDGRAIKGISSIRDVAVITVAGLSMVGVIGVNKRIFSTLADNGISVFLVAQASSENSTSIGVREQDAELACEVLNAEFAKEIATGAMFSMRVQKDLAAIAVVGENMKGTPGISGTLYGALGRSGISVIACAQGASETNISFIVEARSLRKALNVIHDSFFLSEYQELNIFLCGVGTVGGSLLEQIAGQRETLMARRGLKLNVVGIANSSRALIDREGIELDGCLERLHRATPSDINSFKDEIIRMNIFNSVFVDCTASKEVAAIYGELLEHNVNIVAANKIAASSSYSEYRRLKDTARSKGVKFLFETNVGAGLPIINTINSLRNSGDHILKIEAVLSGTLNYIFNTISADIPFSRTVKMAKEEGYSEPDPRIDLCGMDVVRKLVILSRESGYVMEQEDVRKELFVPDEFFSGSLEEFWKRLPELDADFEERRRKLEAEGKCWRFVACLEDGKGSVSLREVSRGHSFYNLAGSNNIILLTTERYKQYPMLIQGYGAGAEVTAAGVFGDIMNIANI